MENMYLDDFMEMQQNGFKEKMNSYGYYAVDGGQTKLIYEHKSNKSKIIFTLNYDKQDIKDNKQFKNYELFVDFINDKNEKYSGNSWYLGNQDRLVIDDIFNIISTGDYIKFTENFLTLEKYILTKNKDFFKILKDRYGYDLHLNDTDHIILHSKNNLMQIQIFRDMEKMTISYNIFNFRSERFYDNNFQVSNINTILSILQTEEYKKFIDETIKAKNLNNIEGLSPFNNVRIHKGSDNWKILELDKYLGKEITQTQAEIGRICAEISNLLIYKNIKYGNSAIEPINIFYKGDNENSILIRLDDKLSRIRNNKDDIRVNDICDTIGYLVLLLIHKGVKPEQIEKLKD